MFRDETDGATAAPACARAGKTLATKTLPVARAPEGRRPARAGVRVKPSIAERRRYTRPMGDGFIPRCPRCGYDQSGVAASWSASCPMEGICSECGLRFPWVDAMRPDLHRVRGLYEHARTGRERRRWVLTTLWLVARPWAFWSRVTMAMTPRLGMVRTPRTAGASG